MKPLLTARREAGVPLARESALAEAEMGSAVHGLILYLAALALAGASLSVNAEPVRSAVEAKRSAAAQMYVALHLQQYTGMCSESYAAAGPRGSSLCQHEAAVEVVRPSNRPALRASLSSKGLQ